MRRNGFTIVELLVTIAVIAILAVIAAGTYNDIREKSIVSGLQGGLQEVGLDITSYAKEHGGVYPADLSVVDVSEDQGTLHYQYTANNTASPPTYCLTAADTRLVGTAYHVNSDSGRPTEGACSGHTTNPGYVNLASNASFEISSSVTSARTNLFFNPRQVAGAGLGGGWTAVTGQTDFDTLDTAARGVADVGWKSFYISGSMPYTGTATPIAIRFWAKANKTGWIMQNLTGNINVLSTWGGTLTRLDTNQVVSDIVGDDVAREYSLTFTIPTTQTTAWTFGFKHNSATADATKNITATGFLAEQANATDSFFDGSSEASDGISYAWSGTADNSISYMRGLTLANVNTNRVASIQTSQWSDHGSNSLLQVPMSTTSNDNYTELLSGGMIPVSSLKPSTLYTLMATVKVVEPLTGSLAGNGSRSLFVHLNGTGITLTGTKQAPNVPGTYDLRATFTTPSAFTGYNTIRLYHGGYTGSGYLYWDKIGLVEGDYTGQWFQ